MDENSKDINSSKKLIILGVITLDVVANKLAAMGHTYQKKTLTSDPKNWSATVKNIRQLKNEDKLLGVVLLVQPRLLEFVLTPGISKYGGPYGLKFSLSLHLFLYQMLIFQEQNLGPKENTLYNL